MIRKNSDKNVGMTVKQYIGENDKEYLVVKHKVGNLVDDTQYKEYFERLKDEGILLNNFYDDEKWICFEDKDSPTKALSFSFMEAYPETKIIVKNYMLLKLYVQRSSLTTVKKRLMHIRHFMQDTEFMNPDNVKDYQLILNTWNDNKKREAISVREFLEFSNLENAELYFDVLKNIRKAENSYRNLPNFQGILTFDYIVNDYWNRVQSLGNEDKYRLFPIILWWKLTTIIPTRPIEFFNLKRDCVFEKESRYFFKIERQKTQLDKNFVSSDIITNFEIDAELYFLIHDYVCYCNKIDDCQYLISPPTCDVIYRGKVLNTRQKFTYKKMNEYYKTFQNEIVQGQYNYKVVRSHDTKEGELPYIFYGDTRHFAIMNMMLMGTNPIYIAQISGHHTLDAQIGYYSHVDTFVTAKAYVLNKFMKKDVLLGKNNLEQDARNVTALIKRDMLGAGFYTLPEVMGGQGRCSSKNFPYECNHKSCLFCKFFLAENVSESYLDRYREENEKDIQMIKTELKGLLGQITQRDELSIRQDALQLGALLNQKIFIDSYTYMKGEE